MTVLNLQTKLSKNYVSSPPSEKDIRIVLAIVRIIVYPSKFIKGLSIYKTVTIGGILMSFHLKNFKKKFKHADEFTRMNLFSDIMLLRETLEESYLATKDDAIKSSNVPFLNSISKKIDIIYHKLVNIENQYHKIIYPDSPDSNSPEFRELLKKEYAGFALED